MKITTKGNTKYSPTKSLPSGNMSKEFARETFRKYNYAAIRTPIFGHYEVINRSVGDTTNV